jgi:hypothetical protein
MRSIHQRKYAIAQTSRLVGAAAQAGVEFFSCQRARADVVAQAAADQMIVLNYRREKTAVFGWAVVDFSSSRSFVDDGQSVSVRAFPKGTLP